MKKKRIKRRCSCGCGQITNDGKKYINGHNNSYKRSKETRRKMSLAHKDKAPWNKGKAHPKEIKRKISLSMEGNINSKGKIRTKESRLKMSISKIKCNPNYKYCDEWKDKKYKKDCMKDYCENADCRGKTKNLIPHHINLNPKDCRPFNVMTLCNSCHSLLHRQLERKKRKAINLKDYLIIIRKDRVTYIHKVTKTKIILKRR